MGSLYQKLIAVWCYIWTPSVHPSSHLCYFSCCFQDEACYTCSFCMEHVSAQLGRQEWNLLSQYIFSPCVNQLLSVSLCFQLLPALSLENWV